MSLSQLHQSGALQAVVGEPEVVEDLVRRFPDQVDLIRRLAN